MSNNNLFKEFEELINSISKEVIEKSVLTELKNLNESSRITISQIPSKVEALDDVNTSIEKFKKDVETISDNMSTSQNLINKNIDEVTRKFNDELYPSLISNQENTNQILQELQNNLVQTTYILKSEIIKTQDRIEKDAIDNINFQKKLDTSLEGIECLVEEKYVTIEKQNEKQLNQILEEINKKSKKNFITMIISIAISVATLVAIFIVK